MKRILKIALGLVLLVCVGTACSGQKEEPLYYEDGIVNLHGPWEDQKGPVTNGDEQRGMVAAHLEKNNGLASVEATEE